jgi:hypothetical protein
MVPSLLARPAIIYHIEVYAHVYNTAPVVYVLSILVCSAHYKAIPMLDAALTCVNHKSDLLPHVGPAI